MFKIDLSRLHPVGQNPDPELGGPPTPESDPAAYLASTDWMIIRRAETGKSVPREVLDKRKAAREALENSRGAQQ